MYVFVRRECEQRRGRGEPSVDGFFSKFKTIYQHKLTLREVLTIDLIYSLKMFQNKPFDVSTLKFVSEGGPLDTLQVTPCSINPQSNTLIPFFVSVKVHTPAKISPGGSSLPSIFEIQYTSTACWFSDKLTGVTKYVNQVPVLFKYLIHFISLFVRNNLCLYLNIFWVIERYIICIKESVIFVQNRKRF